MKLYVSYIAKKKELKKTNNNGSQCRSSKYYINMSLRSVPATGRSEVLNFSDHLGKIVPGMKHLGISNYCGIASGW